MNFFAVSVLFSISAVSVCGNLKLSHLNTLYLPNKDGEIGFDKRSVEQLAYSKTEKLIYAVGEGIIHVIDAANITDQLELLKSFYVPNTDLTDIEVCGEHVFVSVHNKTDPNNGTVIVYKQYDKNNLTLDQVHVIDVGNLPDMLQVRPDCKTVVVALEASAFVDDSNQFNDPEGAVVIITFPDGVEETTEPVVTVADFTDFNSRVDELLTQGVRYVFRESNFSSDVEPEYVSIDEKNNVAFISLQENNAIAEVDLKSKQVKEIHGLGSKQWGYFDASDKDGGSYLTYWPIKSFYQPDAIHYHTWKGHRLVFTANEGDAKEYENIFSEEKRGEDFLDNEFNSSIPEFVRKALKDSTKLGRLKFTTVDGVSETGVYEELYAFGGRGFSVFDADNGFTRLYDSGSDFEETTARLCPHLYNKNTEAAVDSRSDDKGPESESLAVVEIKGKLFVFVGNERPGTISVYSFSHDISEAKFETIYCEGVPDSQLSVDDLHRQRLVQFSDPEDMKFLDTDVTNEDFPILVVVGSYSGTIAVLKVNTTDVEPATDQRPPTTIMPYVCDKASSYRDIQSINLAYSFFIFIIVSKLYLF